jgi:hypothetical protein
MKEGKKSFKRWRVKITVLSLPSSIATQGVEVRAGNGGLAVNRAYMELKKPGKAFHRRRMPSFSVNVLFLGEGS